MIECSIVVGSSGFLGRRLCRLLSEEGTRVVGIQRAIHSSGLPLYLIRPVSSVLNPEEVDRAIAGTDAGVLFNVTAGAVRRDVPATPDQLAVNALAPALLVEACRKADIRSIVHVGSGFEYEPSNVPLGEDAKLAGVNVYGASKAAGFLIARQAAAESGIQLSTVRPFSMYGPGDGEHRLFQRLIRSATHCTPLDMTSANQIRDYVHVDDVAAAIIAAGESTAPAEVYNIGAGEDGAMSVRETAVNVFEHLGADHRLLRFGALTANRPEPDYFVADIRRAQSNLGWTPTIDLKRGVQTLL